VQSLASVRVLHDGLRTKSLLIIHYFSGIAANNLLKIVGRVLEGSGEVGTGFFSTEPLMIRLCLVYTTRWQNNAELILGCYRYNRFYNLQTFVYQYTQLYIYSSADTASDVTIIKTCKIFGVFGKMWDIT